MKELAIITLMDMVMVMERASEAGFKEFQRRADAYPGNKTEYIAIFWKEKNWS